MKKIRNKFFKTLSNWKDWCDRLAKHHGGIVEYKIKGTAHLEARFFKRDKDWKKYRVTYLQAEWITKSGVIVDNSDNPLTSPLKK